MSLIGMKVAREGEEFTIVGETPNGCYALAPVEFGSPIEVTVAELQTTFGVEVDAPEPVDEPEAWRQVGERFQRRTRMERQHVRLPRPEESLRGPEDPAVVAAAQALANDSEAVAQYEVGLLPINDAVALALDDILFERATALREAGEEAHQEAVREGRKPRSRRRKPETPSVEHTGFINADD